MTIYLLSGVISVFLAYISNNYLKKGQKKRGIIFLVIAFLLLSIIAGLRTTTLGYDTEKYGIQTFNAASNSNFNNYLNYMKNSSREKGFLMIVFILDKIFDNINFVLFGVNFILGISMFLFAYYYREKSNIIVIMLLYICTLYPQSYNVLRQCLSLAFCFIFIILLDKKKYILATIVMILGLTFHNSAFMMLTIPIISWVCDTNKLNKQMKIGMITLSIGLIVIMLLIYPIAITKLYEFGIIGERYLHYLDENSSDHYSSINISYPILIEKTVVIFIALVYYCNNHISAKEKKDNLKWFFMLCIDYIFMFLTFNLRNTSRIAWYYYYPALFIFIPQTVKIFKKDKFNQICGYTLICTLFIVEYLVQMFIRNVHGIYPYNWIL